MTITIREITTDNWVEAIKLKVKDEQENFVASNAISIAQSKFHTFLECYGIYAEDEMVGFSALGKNPEDGTIWIVRHMVDAKHQGKGYGKAGLKAAINFIREKFNPESIFLDVEQDNKIATNLYLKAGFKKTSKKHGENSPIYELSLKEYTEEY